MDLCASVLIGMHIVTWHSQIGGPVPYESFNPGVYVACDNETVGKVVVGAYRNSQQNASFYVGKVFAIWKIDLTLGVVSGYAAAPVIPLIAPSVLIQDHLRLTLMPGGIVDSAWGIHVSWEF